MINVEEGGNEADSKRKSGLSPQQMADWGRKPRGEHSCFQDTPMGYQSSIVAIIDCGNPALAGLSLPKMLHQHNPRGMFPYLNVFMSSFLPVGWGNFVSSQDHSSRCNCAGLFLVALDGVNQETIPLQTHIDSAMRVDSVRVMRPTIPLLYLTDLHTTILKEIGVKFSKLKMCL